MKSALENIKVIDLSRILAGPWASQMLADLGAEVIKVENPKGGDDTRHWGPPFMPSQHNDTEQAAYFHCANRNKKSVAIDISKAQGQALIKSLVKQADVVIENFKVGGLQQYGLDYQSLKSINPTLIFCSITGFGQNGPCAHKAGYDAMIQGEGGLMSLTGEPDGQPMKVGVAVVDVMTGLYAANAIMAALFARQQQNIGQFIDISLLDVQLATLANQGFNYLATGSNPTRHGNGHPNIVPYQTFATLDGYIILAIGNDRQFEKFCQLINRIELAEDPKYSTNQARVNNRQKLIAILNEELAQRTCQWWLEHLEPLSVPCGAVNQLSDVFNHPQIKHRQMVQLFNHDNNALAATIANPINLSKTPVSYRSAPPALGQQTREILSTSLGLSEEVIDKLYQDNIIA
ncbi:CaiB/BaiF CoA transferase family protein [Thalassotalea ganghwensis]